MNQPVTIASPAPAATQPAPASTVQAQPKGLWMGVAMLLLLCLLTAPFFTDMIDRRAPHPKNGAVSFAAWGPLKNPVELNGDWGFEWQSGGIAGPTPTIMRIPERWEGASAPGGTPLPNLGRAKYSLKITGLPAGRYRLYVPQIYGGNQVFLNGELVSSFGRLGTDAATTRYVVRSHDIAFVTKGEDVKVEIRIAAFLHRDSGIDRSPVLGLAGPMQLWTGVQFSQEFLFLTGQILVFLYGIVVFIYRRSERASLFLGLSTIFFVPTSAVLGYDNLFIMAFPGLSFLQMQVIHFLGTEIALFFFLAYADALFPEESPQWAFRTLMAGIVALVVAQVAAFAIGGTLLGSKVNLGLMPMTLAVTLYIIFVLVRAVMAKRGGALVFLLGMGTFLIAALMLVFVAYGLVPSDKMPGMDFTTFGMLLLLFSNIIILAERWSLAIAGTETMNSDLRQLLEVNSSIATEMELESLLGRIVAVTTRIIRAERSSLFLYDKDRGDLWSLIAEGVGTRQIRFPVSEGIAGAAFASGEVVNVDNAYDDARFNAAFDEQTGFRTRSILTMPVKARDGRILGVMQALNRQGGGGFTDADIARMGAFAAQAAISIDNATLFSEVLSERNYNESILGSMSSGVITLDSEVRVAKLNEAAARMLRVTETGFQGADLRAVLADTNPWLIAEIDAVIADGSPRNLLDIDLVTNQQGHISANITFVPLKSGKEPVGLLILIEDISAGKRLEGAMRRFMPQEVLKEVLDRDDDAMFGTAIPASVLFADIRSFTSMAETLSARETVDMLNEIFTDLFEAVASTSGMIDKYMGDAVMAVYGAPLPGINDATNAVEGAIEMVRLIAMLNERRVARGQQALRLGIGIASGEVVAGTIGSPKRMDYTVIGDSVNLASRLEEATKTYRVSTIICEGTAAKVEGKVPLRELDLIRVRGRSKPAKIFEVLHAGGPGEAAVAAYAQGRACLTQFDWAGATAAFERALAAFPEDGAAALMLKRALAAVADPPGEDWDGVW